ncbi:MAG TPA: hypothetical protein VHA11_00045 [Bryobacteraceae bacterium]|nr:hypothetical protein [Bryobacteraceae bacterium]
MKIKSYYARTVEEAVDTASNEMGPDAMLVHSRKAPVEMRHLGPYEVVFALPKSGGSKAGTAGGEAKPHDYGGKAEDIAGASVALELLQMRRQMEEIRRTLAARNVVPSVAPETASAVQQAYRMLIDADIDADLASSVSELAVAELPPQVSRFEPQDEEQQAAQREELWRALKAELLRRMVPCRGVRPRGESASVVALVGPPGAGKTSALIKLAVTVGGASERPLHLISADAWRIGAGEQLHTYASILGITIDTADTPAAVRQAIEANRHKEMILVDTPGLSGADFDLLDDLAGLLARRTDIDKLLVLPATMRSRDLKRCLRNYERFRPDKLLFTHLDETDAFGAMCSAAIAAGIPMAYFSAGQQVPEDLEPASSEKLLDALRLAVDGGRE